MEESPRTLLRRECIRRLGGSEQSISYLGKINEEIKDIPFWRGSFLSVGAIIVLMWIFFNLEGWLRRGHVIELYFTLPALLLVATWFLSCYYWFQERYFPNKEQKDDEQVLD